MCARVAGVTRRNATAADATQATAQIGTVTRRARAVGASRSKSHATSSAPPRPASVSIVGCENQTSPAPASPAATHRARVESASRSRSVASDIAMTAAMSMPYDLTSAL